MKLGVPSPALYGLLMASPSQDASALLAQRPSGAWVAHEGAARAFWRVLTRFDSSKLSPYIALRNSIGVVLPLAAGFALNLPRAGVVVASGARNVAYTPTEVIPTRSAPSACSLPAFCADWPSFLEGSPGTTMWRL